MTIDYHALGLGEAASVITGVTVGKDKQSICISCQYDPQGAAVPYTLYFQHCTEIVWNTFEVLPDFRHLDAELIGFSLQTNGTRSQAVMTTDEFELSFCYESFSLQDDEARTPVIHT